MPEISSGDDALGLINPAGVIVDQIGVPGTDEGNGWTIDGVDDATYNGTIILSLQEFFSPINLVQTGKVPLLAI